MKLLILYHEKSYIKIEISSCILISFMPMRENHPQENAISIRSVRFIVARSNTDATEPKSAIAIARQFRGKEKNFTGEKFWARGYFVSTVGRDEEVIRNYIKNQEQEDIRQDKLPLFSC